MGRSKFPGRPSKHILRKRVNVLPPAEEIAKDEFSGLVTVESLVENKQDEETKEENAANMFMQNVNKKKSIKRRLSRKMKSLINNNRNQRSLLSRLRVTSMKTKLSNGIKTSIIHKMVQNKATKETASLVGTFVLPTRSVHSSRVIKPNKRFVSDMNESISKKKVIIKRQCIKQEDDQSNTTNDPEECKDDKMSCTNGYRVILRQARLKLPSQSGVHGPFTKVSTSPTTTVTCGVCGAVKFDQLVKHTRKYNIYSCELCKKFIAKMIKIQACRRHTSLVCSKGQGTCYVSPISKNQQWKVIKYPSRTRCSACWLKMCLRAFQLPSALKQSLSQLLPKNMQNFDFFNSTLPPLLWQAATDSNPPLLEQSHNKLTESMATKQRPLRFRNTKTPTVTSSPVTNTEVKRQKSDLKGPRVKHVCRTASIVLGQPIATFTDSDKKYSAQSQSKSAEDKTGHMDKKNELPCGESEVNIRDKLPPPVNEIPEPCLKRDRPFRNLSLQAQNSIKMLEETMNLDPQLGISINFWDGYDLRNIYQNGFCLIGSEQFPAIAVCFLCGSAGRDQIYYCSLCCEPYHSFCLEQDTITTTLQIGKEHNWICPKCITCSRCNTSDRLKVNCLKCLKPYHPECLNSESEFDRNILVCSECFKCSKCSSTCDTYFTGSCMICTTCFTRKKEEKTCPVCQNPYRNKDVVPKMLECTKCVEWIHAKCENLTEDQYQILCLLPESVEYVCSSCSKNSLWKIFVNNELKRRFKRTLRILMKNKTAKSLLRIKLEKSKQTPMLEKVQLSEETDSDNNNSHEEISDFSKESDKFEFLLTKDKNTLSLINIKNKLNSNEYIPVQKFYRDIEECLKNLKCDELLKKFQVIFDQVFPWYKSSKNQTNEIDIFQESLYYSSANEELVTEGMYFAYDSRVCEFCRGLGDGSLKKESRLLYCGQNKWVHANCALWSSDVYEEIDGYLQNVQDALKRARLTRCSHCKQRGASVSCCYKGCHEFYHFTCARSVKLKFSRDKSVFCSTHEMQGRNQLLLHKEENFIIRRPMFVQLDNIKEKFVDIDKVNLMIGSLCVKNLGKIDTVASDHTDFIVPIGFVCTRMFWSTVEPWKIIPYTIITSMKNSNSSALNMDKNFTINHSLDKITVDKLIREVNVWQKDFDKKMYGTESEDEEQQNGADLLSPELTDAILEELPHGLLDGIWQQQDIFPKFSSEDSINIDYKSDTTNMEGTLDAYKKGDLEDSIQDEINEQKSISPDKSSTNELSNSRTPQRSCNFSIKCKIDSSLSPIIKKRRMTGTRENNMVYQLLQVDGNCDDSSSECDSPSGHLEQETWNSYVIEEPVTCEKCHCTYRTQASYKRHLDSCEVLCTSESDSEVIPDQDLITLSALPGSSIHTHNVTEPVLISSYESYQSEIHTSVLNTQSYLVSKSTTELLAAPQISDVAIQKSVPPVIGHKAVIQTVPVSTIPPVSIESSNTEQNFTLHEPTFSVNSNASLSIPTNQTQFCNLDQTVPLCVSQPITLEQNNIQSSFAENLLSVTPTSTISIPSTSSVSDNQINLPIDFKTQSVSIEQVPSIVNSDPQSQYSLNGKLVVNPVIQTVSVPESQWIKPINSKPAGVHKPVKLKAQCRTIAAKKPHFEEDNSIVPTQNSTGQLIVQQFPSANYVPTFVDAFQQQNQNVQYVATITPPTLPTQQLVQIPSYNNIIGLVPGLQRAMYIQQPRMLENQLIVDSSGAIGWSPQQSIQPIFYGFETIVQNTVMQSQQFLPTTMPGVLTANSSYSTTTQVFQTSKLEPVLDVSTNSFILLNPGTLVNSQPIVNPQPILNTQSLTTPQLLTNSQQMINRQPLNSSQQVINLQPIVTTQALMSANSQSVVNSRPNPNPQTIISSQPIVVAQPILKAHEIKPPQYNSTEPMAVKHKKLMKPEVNKPASPQSHIAVKQPQIMHSNPVNSQVEVKIPQPQNKVKPMPSQFKVNSSHSQEVKSQIQPKLDANLSQPNSQNAKYSTNPLNKPVNSSCSNITLPTSFISDQGIPTNIVAPIPKPAPTRPMSRVLPMPTSVVKESEKFSSLDEKVSLSKQKYPSEIDHEELKRSAELKTDTISEELKLKVSIEEFKASMEELTTSTDEDRHKASVEELKLKTMAVSEGDSKDIYTNDSNIKLVVNSLVKPSTAVGETKEDDLKLTKMEERSQETEKLPPTEPVQKVVEISISEDTKVHTSLKLVFQKQGEDGLYTISNNFKQPIQIATLKPIKSFNSDAEQVCSKYDHLKEKMEKSNSESSSKSQTKKESNSMMLYSIETQDGFRYSSSSITNLWSMVIDSVQSARAAHNMPPLPIDSGILDPVHALGLKSDGLKYLIEQLPGITKCSKYKSLFKFPPHPSEIDDDYSHHSFGSVRCHPHDRKNIGHYDIFGWLSSKHRQPEQISLDTLELLPRRVVNLPMTMKFRQLKLTSKFSVGVYRSCIHGRGLFCLRDIEAGEMVIEYAGEVIRSILTDKREKHYNSKGIGCYMFRVDDNFVVDATMKGNAARFINHSCEPNCYSRVVEILGHKHIIIFALRRILSGEELTYDYKFPFEEDKIPCTCGSRKCRKFLN